MSEKKRGSGRFLSQGFAFALSALFKRSIFRAFCEKCAVHRLGFFSKAVLRLCRTAFEKKHGQNKAAADDEASQIVFVPDKAPSGFPFDNPHAMRIK
ncbi:MAG: hypothetical protein H7834_09565 [Magnetococcus sp. YQC-9]